MSLKKICPCDADGFCPYADIHSGYMNSCEYWCGAEEPEIDNDGYERWEVESSRDDWDEEE